MHNFDTRGRLLALLFIFLLIVAFSPIHAGSIVVSAYRTIQDEAVALALRSTVNFTGAGVTCADNVPSLRTDCTIPGGVTNAYGTIQQAGTPLTQRATLNFIGSPITCVDNAGATRTDCTVTGGAASTLVRACEMIVGSVGTNSIALADDNDAPVECGNKTGATLTITAVECYANAGTPTVTPIITGGGATSILTGALTCGAGSFATGTLNGTPTQTANQTIDGNITTAGGTAVYVVMRITRTL